MIDNSYIFWMILIGASTSIIGAFVRIFFPNYFINKYISGEIKPSKDNWIRCGGLVSLLWFGFILLWFLGYVK